MLGLDMGYLLRNGNWVTLRFLLVTATGFILSLAFARYGDKELLGQYQFILSMLSIVSVSSLLGLNAAALESVAQGREAAVFKAARMIFKFSLIGSFVIMLFGTIYAIYSRQNDNEFVVLLVIVGLLFPVFYATSSWSAFYEGKLLFKESSLRAIALNIVLTILLISIILLDFGVSALILTYLGVYICFQGSYLFAIQRKISKKHDDTIDVRFGVAVSIQKFVSGLSTNIPPIALSFYFGIELLAIYYIAYYAVGASSAFLNNLMSLYLPSLFKKISLNHRGILTSSLISGVGMIVLFLIFLKILFIPIYGQAYADSLRLAYLISPLLILAPFHIYLVNFFSIQRRNRFLILIFCTSNIFGLITLHYASKFGFITGTALYVLSIELTTVLPLLVSYLRTEVSAAMKDSNISQKNGVKLGS